jgi:hypothetical protein
MKVRTKIKLDYANALDFWVALPLHLAHLGSHATYIKNMTFKFQKGI